MAQPQGRLYNALNGRELRRAIIREVEDLLENDDRFSSGIAFPKVSFKFDLTVKVYPREPESFALSTEKVYGESDAEPTETVLSRERENEHPDKVRQFTGDPVPRPQQVKHVGLVDLTGEQVQESRTIPDKEPLIIPATEMPPLTKTPKQQVSVSGVNGSAGKQTIEIEGHVAKPHEIDMETESREPAARVSISNDAAVRGDWAKRNGLGNPVYAEDKVPK